MKTFDKMAAQGDFIIMKVDAIPAGAIQITPNCKGQHVIAHSETGHNHVMLAERVRAFNPVKPDIYTMFLQVDEPTEITHLRNFDTHEPILVPPGNYIVKRQREYTPEGWRRAQD